MEQNEPKRGRGRPKKPDELKIKNFTIGLPPEVAAHFSGEEGRERVRKVLKMLYTIESL